CNCIGMVAEDAMGLVVGFMVYELHKRQLHLLKFAVAKRYRRLGVGAQMVAKLVGKLGPHLLTRIVLEVRESNLAAQLFFRAQGFGPEPLSANTTKTRPKSPTSWS